jgi:hypothetical protein
LQDRLTRFAERKITTLDDQGQLVTEEELGPEGKKDRAQAHVRVVRGGSVDAKKGMFELDPKIKMDMIKK